MKSILLRVKPKAQVRPAITAGYVTGQLLTLALLTLFCGRADATVPIPDQVIYGTIAIQNKAVTNNSAATNVVIEARRASDNYLLTSYRMGTSTNQGKLFYVLRVPMEDAPASSVEFAEPSDQLVLIVKKSNITQFTSTNLPLDSGTALRFDFGASVDTDGDGVPDGWELTRFGGGDIDADVASDLAEYVAGTMPDVPGDGFRLNIQNTNGLTLVGFQALAAEGVGYAATTRYYAIERTTNLAAAAWATVPGFDRIPGNNQTVRYAAASNSPAYFRGRVWLEGGGTKTDTDADGIPDAWEVAHVGNIYASYVSGALPNNTNDALRVGIEKLTNGTMQVSFRTLAAQGVGYEGRTRYYALETATSVLATSWRTITNYSRIKGTNQVVIFNSPNTVTTDQAPVFFRARVWLEGP